MREEPSWRRRQEKRGREQPSRTPTPAPAPPAPQLNVKGDVIWALRAASGGALTTYDIGMKIAQERKIRYPETKILHVLDMLVQDGKVKKSEAPPFTYTWDVEAV